MACLLFNAEVGVKPTSVAYRGSGPALNDVVGGQIDYLCEQIDERGRADQGRHGEGAMSSPPPQRLAALPNVPTAKEAGDQATR